MMQARLTQARERLLRQLAYRFDDFSLYARSLTHRSAKSNNNERLEFLGDAILGFLIAEEIYRRAPALSEGELTRLRASLVRRETLAQIARELELGCSMEVGVGELKSGGRNRDSMLADAIEALIGAIYLDGGIEHCRRVVLALFHARLDRAISKRELKDPKTRLQEFLQARGESLPVYQVQSAVGAAHDQSFTVSCEVTALELTSHGEGSSRRRAEQAAAALILKKIELGELT